MSTIDYLIDTNILIYHTEGSQSSIDFLTDIISHQSLNISILTKIEFLGWNKHTPEGFEKCKQLIESANIYSVDENVANKAIDLRREMSAPSKANISKLENPARVAANHRHGTKPCV